MGFRISVDTGGTFTDLVVADDAGASSGEGADRSERAFRRHETAAWSTRAGELGTTLRASCSRRRPYVHVRHDPRDQRRPRRARPRGPRSSPPRATPTSCCSARAEARPVRPRTLPIPGLRSAAPDLRGAGAHRLLTGETPPPAGRGASSPIARQLAARAWRRSRVCLLWSIANPAHELRVGELLGESARMSRSRSRTSSTRSSASTGGASSHRDRRLAEAADAGLPHELDERPARRRASRADLFVATSFGGVPATRTRSPRADLLGRLGPVDGAGRRPHLRRAERGAETPIVVRHRRHDLRRRPGPRAARSPSRARRGSAAVDRPHHRHPRRRRAESIGAGGGSIAWIDPGGLLRVGPQSAGAVPGPGLLRARRRRSRRSPTPPSCSAGSIPATSWAARCTSTPDAARDGGRERRRRRRSASPCTRRPTRS